MALFKSSLRTAISELAYSLSCPLVDMTYAYLAGMHTVYTNTGTSPGHIFQHFAMFFVAATSGAD